MRTNVTEEGLAFETPAAIEICSVMTKVYQWIVSVSIRMDSVILMAIACPSPIRHSVTNSELGSGAIFRQRTSENIVIEEFVEIITESECTSREYWLKKLCLTVLVSSHDPNRS